MKDPGGSEEEWPIKCICPFCEDAMVELWEADDSVWGGICKPCGHYLELTVMPQMGRRNGKGGTEEVD